MKTYREGRIEGYKQALEDWGGLPLTPKVIEEVIEDFKKEEERRDEIGSFVPAKDRKIIRELIEAQRNKT